VSVLNARSGAISALILTGTLLLSACASDDSDDAGDSASVAVVASTNVWGDIAARVGGDHVKVTSVISDPDQDPHSYEADSKTALEISKAKIIIENGGGYDDFVDTMVESGDSEAVVINAVDVSGKKAPADGELNEHVWYDFDAAGKVADEIAAELSEADPDHASTFTENADAFNDDLKKLSSEAADIKSAHEGERIGITEPVPLYLTEAAGLINETPDEFSEAVEEGEDVSAQVLKETLDLYTDHKVKALVYNEQTSGPVTDQVKSAAEEAGVAVVPVTETLPDGLSYIDWMTENLDALNAALDQG